MHLAAAVLGSADPDHLLRQVRHRARARKGSAGRAAVRRGLQARRHRHLAAGARRVVVSRRPCPTCGASARRETDVSDTFLDSAWYFLRYPSTDFAATSRSIATITNKWLPVTSYIGGNEHAVLHLLYSRFVTMVLHDAGHVDVRGAVQAVPRARHDRPRRRQDVEESRQRRESRRVHRATGARTRSART